jgi:hypothetical protein
MKETIIWACKIGEPAWSEEIIFAQKGYVNAEKLMQEANEKAESFGYDRLRLSIIDPNEKPNFIAAVNV